MQGPGTRAVATGRDDAAAGRSPTAAPRDLAGLSYLVMTTGGAGEQPAPLVVALHGLGDSPEGFRSLFDGFGGRARIVLLRAPLAWQGGFSWWEYRASDVDSAERSRAMAAAATAVARAIGAARRAFPTVGHPIVTGFSQGGMLSFALASRHPDAIGEALPVSGGLPEPLRPTGAPAPVGKRLPRVHALHGAADDRVPLGPARATIDRLTSAGYDAKISTFDGVGHTIPPAMRAALHQALGEAVARAARDSAQND